MTHPPGRLIAFEGIDGCGKTTFVNEIHHWLQQQGYVNAIKTSAMSEGSTPVGEAIGDVLRNTAMSPISPASEALMVIAARKDNWDHIIDPALKSGKWVVTDRHIDSMFCYQTEVSEHWLDMVCTDLGTQQEADITFLIDIPHDYHRVIRVPGDRLEARSARWWEKCRNDFLDRFTIMKREGLHFVIDNRYSLVDRLSIVKSLIKDNLFQHS
ncbi:MAG: dTMP kinase [Gammaproteobacteria bacterium AqS3]|nr:dTMP kinase [Gammaproteobacteria bacterium AqS3]